MKCCINTFLATLAPCTNELPLWDVHKFPYKCRIGGPGCFPTVSDGFRPVSGPPRDVHKFPYKCRISGYSCFPTVSDGFRPVSDLFGTISGYSCFPTVSDGFRPVSDLFGMSTNFHTNVGSADIAAFLQFQTVSELFQTSLGCPQISIQM